MKLDTSREFPCPACDGRVMLGKSPEGDGDELYVLHTVPACQHYLVNEDPEVLLGPVNYAKLGEPLEN